MKQLKTILSISALFVGLFVSSPVFAERAFVGWLNDAYPNQINNSSCEVCHETTSDDPRQFSPYGTALLLIGADDDDSQALLTQRMRNIEIKDYDNDGFTVKQEIYGGSFSGGYLSGTPSLTGTPVVQGTNISAEPAINETISSVSLTAASVTLPLATGEKVLGSGYVDYEMTNLTVPATGNSTGTATFMYKVGGVQSGSKAYMLDASNSPSPVTSIINSDGSITITVTDESSSDLYSVANYIAQAKTRTAGKAGTATVDAYATVDPTAVISPYATINAYATIGAYALIGEGATIDMYVTVDDYAMVAADTTIANNATNDVTVPIPATFVGTIQSRIAVSTAVPTVGTLPAGTFDTGSSGGGTSGQSSGGLHCMTLGLGTQGFMFLSLLATAFLVRRKKY